MELKDKEIQIIEYIAQGLTNKEIAKIMLTSASSFKNILGKLFKKFDVDGQKNARVRLIIKYYREFDKNHMLV